MDTDTTQTTDAPDTSTEASTDDQPEIVVPNPADLAWGLLQPQTWPTPDRLSQYYGDPSKGGHDLDPWWEENMLTDTCAPWKMITAWDVQNQFDGKAAPRQVRSFRVHKTVRMSLGRVLGAIWQEFDCDQEKIEAKGLHLFGGAFNFRPIRGGNTLSLHAYGAAIDLNPDGNPLGAKWDKKNGMPPIVVEAFEAEGWRWGGRFKNRKDCMHFEACNE